MEAALRRARLADADALARVHVASWQSSYRGIVPQAYLDSLSVADRAERWRRILGTAEGAPIQLVAEAESRVVGFASAGPSRDPGPWKGEVLAIYLEEEAKGRGIGRALFAEAARELVAHGLDSMHLWVLAGNARARRFYDRAGGRVVESRVEDVGGAMLEEVRYAWDDLPGSPILRASRE